jgi:ElaB/YqjD/DUF883 family membrane-anchored ribosome-binding protein
VEEVMSSTLNDDQRSFYEDARERTKSEIEEFQSQIDAELAKVKERIADLQNGVKAARQMYDAACLMLGVPNEFDDEDSDD